MPQTSPPAPNTEEPKIWNPSSAANWSIILSPVFGAYILAQNAKTTNNHKSARAHTIWLWISIAYQIIAVICSLTQDFSIRGTGLIILFAWYLTAAKRDIIAFKSTQAVANRAWTKPVSIGLASALAVYVVSVFGPGTGASSELAQRAATEFHASYNTGDFKTIYDKSSQDFKTKTPYNNFATFMSGASHKLGKHISSTQSGWHIHSLNGTKTITIIFDSKFESLRAKETFMYRISKNDASLLGYNLSSADLLAK